MFHAITRLASRFVDAYGLRRPDVPARALGEDRAAFLVIDTPMATSYVTRADLDSWAIPEEQLWEDALCNLRDRTTDKWTAIAPNLVAGAWADYYDCSRLLLPDLFYRLEFSGRPVALIPSRGDILVTSDQAPEMQLQMLHLATSRLDETPRWCAPSLLVLDEGAWKSYMPESPEVRHAHAKLRIRMMAEDYADQKRQLESDLLAIGCDVFVASYLVLESNDKSQLWSMTTWTKGVEAYLPEADRVVFGDAVGGVNPAPMIVVPWEDAFAIAGSLMTRLPTYPPRYHITGFPDEAMLAKLAEKDVKLATGA